MYYEVLPFLAVLYLVKQKGVNMITLSPNFPVPSYKIIKNIETEYPKVLKPGLIKHTLNICEELTQLHKK